MNDEINKMVSELGDDKYSKNDVNVLIQLTSLHTKLDNLNNTINNHNNKIDGYKRETDKVVVELRNEIKLINSNSMQELKGLKKETVVELDKVKERLDKNEKFAYKVSGALIILSIIWAFLSRHIVNFFT